MEKDEQEPQHTLSISPQLILVLYPLLGGDLNIWAADAEISSPPHGLGVLQGAFQRGFVAHEVLFASNRRLTAMETPEADCFDVSKIVVTATRPTRDCSSYKKWLLPSV
jgi:hypothetical protein